MAGSLTECAVTSTLEVTIVGTVSESYGSFPLVRSGREIEIASIEALPIGDALRVSLTHPPPDWTTRRARHRSQSPGRDKGILFRVSNRRLHCRRHAGWRSP
jgi:hypothetical protein